MSSEAPVIVTATRLETLGVLLWTRARVLRAGVGLSRLDPRREWPAALVSCGLAGSLAPEIGPGAVVVPDYVEDPERGRYDCDPALTADLRRAARRLGVPTLAGGMLTAPRLVTGAERARYAARGLIAVDMEAADLARAGHRIAALKIVLDSPGAELSDAWLRPLRAMADLGLWPQLAFLAARAPIYAARAGRIAALAVQPRPLPGDVLPDHG